MSVCADTKVLNANEKDRVLYEDEVHYSKVKLMQRHELKQKTSILEITLLIHLKFSAIFRGMKIMSSAASVFLFHELLSSFPEYSRESAQMYYKQVIS